MNKVQFLLIYFTSGLHDNFKDVSHDVVCVVTILTLVTMQGGTTMKLVTNTSSYPALYGKDISGLASRRLVCMAVRLFISNPAARFTFVLSEQ